MQISSYASFVIIFVTIHKISCLQYLSGDFLSDSQTKSPSGEYYPRKDVETYLKKDAFHSRRNRAMRFVDDPWNVRKKLLEGYTMSREVYRRSLAGRDIRTNYRSETNSVLPADIDAIVKISNSSSTSSSSSASPSTASCTSSRTPQRLCKTRFNTTAPMFGVSLTSGKPVTIVQKFPDLLQQVIFEVCESDTCDVVHGECVQTYIPYLFLVIPLGPVTLTGQDYILVESGCVCQPKYAHDKTPPNPLDAIHASNNYS